MILVAVVWSGDELVGRTGIEDLITWPYTSPEGDKYQRLLDQVQEALIGFSADCHRYGVHSAAVVSAPDPGTYGFTKRGPYASWMNDLAAWFQDEVYPSQIGKRRFRLVDSNVLTIRLEFKDQWHAEKSDENANHIYSFCNSMFHLMMRLYVLADTSLEVKAVSAMTRPTDVLEARSDRRPAHQRYTRTSSRALQRSAISVPWQLQSSQSSPIERRQSQNEADLAGHLRGKRCNRRKDPGAHRRGAQYQSRHL